tara:strand:+ start:456 stop:710 length:255 start_codon:yes stop_codon:yes gene_type:complete
MKLSIDTDQEGLDVISSLVATHNANLQAGEPELSEVEYLEHLLETMIGSWKRSAFMAARDEIGALFADKSYAARLATIAKLKAQ